MASAAADGETDSEKNDIEAIANFDVYHREAMEERVSAFCSLLRFVLDKIDLCVVFTGNCVCF